MALTALEKRFSALAEYMIDNNLCATVVGGIAPVAEMSFAPSLPTFVHIIWHETATQEQKDNVLNIVTNWDWTTNAQNNYERLKAREQALADTTKDNSHTILLRSALKIVFDAITKDREYMVQLRNEIIRLGGNVPNPPTVRTWKQLEQALQLMVNLGQGDYT